MQSSELTLMDTVSQISAAFSAAITDIITSNGHGLKENDKVVLTTTGTLPAGLALATTYYAKAITTNTFKVSTSPEMATGQFVDITDTGTGTHTFTTRLDGNALDVSATNTAILELIGSSTAVLTVKLQGSTQNTQPTWTSVQSATNRYEYKAAQNQQDPYTIKKGDTGIAFAADGTLQYLVDVRGLQWLNAIISAYTTGKVTIKATLTK